MCSPGSTRAPAFLGDFRLIPRLREYMADSPFRHVSPGHINFSLVASDLISTHSEYRRKKLQPFKVSVESAWKMIVEEDEKNKRRSLVQGGWVGIGNNADDNNAFVEDFSGSDGVDNREERRPVRLRNYEDTNAVNTMMQDLYSGGAKRLSSASAPCSPKPRVDFGEDSTPDSVKKTKTLTVCAKKKGRKNDGRESTHESMAILKQAKDGLGTQISGRGKNLTVPKKSDKSFADIGGMEETIKEVCKLLVHLKHPEVLNCLGVSPPRGVLLHGPPGCGKTLLAYCIAGELDLPFFCVSGPEIVSGVSGESEQNIRNLFQSAKSQAPCILFLDEVDVIAGNRESASKDMERRIVAQLLSCLDELDSEVVAAPTKPDSTSVPLKDDSENDALETGRAIRSSSKNIFVIGATSRLLAVDPSLRRAGRFDREIALGIPDASARAAILRLLCASTTMDPALSLERLAHETPGFCGADLRALTREAAMVAVDRILQTSFSLGSGRGEVTEGEESRMEDSQTRRLDLFHWFLQQPPLSETSLSSARLEWSDFEAALKIVQPSAKREGFATVPDVTWEDVGALSQVREELAISILAPIRYPEEFESLGLTQPPGILLAGPPGCGKTLLAKAIANESGLNFISVKGPELLNMYVGESERAIRTVFERARNSAPAVIFFDEIDSLCPKRSLSGGSDSSARVVNQLLTEMDGLEVKGKHVFVIGATNRPDIIDPAVMRPGRLDKILFVGFPSSSERREILNAITRRGTRPALAEDVSTSDVADDVRCEGLSGADLAALVREASVSALKEVMGSRDLSRKRDFEGRPVGSTDAQIRVARRNFEDAFKKLKPSVSKKDRVMYEEIRGRAMQLS